MKKPFALSVALLLSACSGHIGSDDADEDPEADGVEAAACAENGDCDDHDPCNGEETCDTDAGECEAGYALEDGTACGSGLRRICLDGECAESRCGDRFVDREAGEGCDPPSAGTCNEDCLVLCEFNEHCDDADPCTADLCDGGVCDNAAYRDGADCGGGSVCCEGECADCCGDDRQCAGGDECTSGRCETNTCVYDFADDGTECDGGACFDGACIECLESDDCDDGLCCDHACLECCDNGDCDDHNPCTDDACNALGICTHMWAVDMTGCAGGVCCAGVCRVSGECCSDADCGGCHGEAVPCPDFSDSWECNEQTGCSTDIVSPCGGGMVYCAGFGIEEYCNMCGCLWEFDPPPGRCEGEFGMDCEGWIGQEECVNCGCTWMDVDCTGTHAACDTYPDMVACSSQRDCVWSGCWSYICG
ncbi:MAG: hypothetical protein ABIJ56_09960 [Pseudomonadota bacterium]